MLLTTFNLDDYDYDALAAGGERLPVGASGPACAVSSARPPRTGQHPAADHRFLQRPFPAVGAFGPHRILGTVISPAPRRTSHRDGAKALCPIGVPRPDRLRVMKKCHDFETDHRRQRRETAEKAQVSEDRRVMRRETLTRSWGYWRSR
jgi:hypothetical protein